MPIVVPNPTPSPPDPVDPGFEPVASFASDSDSDLDATAFIRLYCGWHIAGSIEQTVKLNSNGADVLLLPTTHLTDVSLVEGLDVGEITDYEWSEQGVLSRSFPLGWPVGLRAVAVTFAHGFEDVPREIAAVTRSLSRRLANNPFDALSETRKMGTASITRVYRANTAAEAADYFSGIEKMVLDRYQVSGRA